MICPPPGVAIRSRCTSNIFPKPSFWILSSISNLAESFKSFCTSRRQTDLSPGLTRLSNTRRSAKNHDLPEPRPPCAPLYGAGLSSGSNTAATSTSRVDNALHDLGYDRVVLVASYRQRNDLRPNLRIEHLAVVVGLLGPFTQGLNAAHLLEGFGNRFLGGFGCLVLSAF